MKKLSTTLLLFLLITAACIFIPQIKAVTENETIQASADAHLIEGRPDESFGTFSDFYVATTTNPAQTGNHRGIIKFSLAAIPSGMTIANATLRTYCSYVQNLIAGVTDIEVRNTTDSWIESTVVWNNQPALGNVIDTQTPAVGWVEWNVTEQIIIEYAGDGIASFFLKSETENYDDEVRVSIHSTKEASAGAYAPELYVEYTESEPPTYSNISVSTNITGANALFSSTWSDNVELDTAIFSINSTGSWVNSSLTLSGTGPTKYSTYRYLPSTADVTVGYIWYANDTFNNWNSTNVQTLITVPMTLNISYPQNTTYTSKNIPVDFSASGGAVDIEWWNIKNGTEWVFLENQTYTSPTSIENMTSGTYQFWAYANNTGEASISETVDFTVNIPATPIELEILFPQALTYPTSSVYIELNATGGTTDKIWFNIKVGSEWIYESSQYYTNTTTLTLANNVYTFWAWANNTEGAEDIKLVTFTVQYIPATPTGPGGTSPPTATYVVTIQVVNEQAPVAGIAVVLADSTKTTDSQGYTTFSIAAGIHNLRVLQNGNTVYSTQLTVERDGSWLIDLSRPDDPPKDVTQALGFSVAPELVQVGIIVIIVVILLAFLISQSNKNRNLEKRWRAAGANVKKGIPW